MRTHALRPEFREALWSLAFALWSVAWPAGIVLAGGATPGFLSQRGDAGLRELFEAGLPMSYRLALFAWGVLAFAAMWALLRLRRWLDPGGRSGAAIRWAFSSRSLNLTVFALVLAVVLLISAVESDPVVVWLGGISPGIARFLVSWWWLLLIAFAILSPLGLLCLLNPETLARDRLEHWWRPFWPGLSALVVAVLFWLAMRILSGVALDVAATSVPGVWLVPLHALEYLLLMACDLAAFAWWFSRGRMADAKALGACFFRWGALRAYLGFDLFFAACFLVLAVPVIWLSIFTIYIGPQYEDWHKTGAVDVPAAYMLLMDGMRIAHGKILPGFLGAMWLFDLLLAVALGRLLYQRATDAGVIPLSTHVDVDGAGR